MLRERASWRSSSSSSAPACTRLGLADRATIGNMSPEFGSTCAIFPVDAETLRYLEFTGRPDRADRARRRLRPRAGHVPRPTTPRSRPSPTRSSSTSASVEPSHRGPEAPAGPDRAVERQARRSSSRWRSSTPTRPQALGNIPRRGDRGVVPGLGPAGEDHDDDASKPPRSRAHASGGDRRRRSPSATSPGDGDARGRDRGRARPRPRRDRRDHQLHQHVEPLGDDRRRAAGARRRSSGGSSVKPWVKTSLAPGLDRRHRVPRAAPGSTSTSTSSGSTWSATAARPASGTPVRCRRRSRRRSNDNDLVVCSVLSGNRNFEGRINQDVRNNYLASPPLCVAYALAGRMDVDLLNDAARRGLRRRAGLPARHLAVLARRSSRRSTTRSAPRCSRARYADVFTGDERWRELDMPEGDRYTWPDSTYVRKPPFFDGMDAGARRRSSRSRAPGCSPCSATASRPTTSRPPARSRRTARPGSG